MSAPRVTCTGTLTLSDGSRLVVRDAELVPPVAPVPDPVPDPTPPPAPAPTTKQLSVYLKMWSPSRLPGLAAAAKLGITEVRLAFLQGPGDLVGWGSQTKGQVKADAEALRARSVLVSASIGGQAGAVNLSSPDAFVRNVAAIHAAIGLDLIDWDVEAAMLAGPAVLTVSQTVHDRYGIGTTMAPNGGNVGQYLPVAVELHRRGLLAAYGQQFYGSKSPIPLGSPNALGNTGTAMGRIAEAIRAGIPARLIQVGMMVAANGWSLDQCGQYMAAIRQQWPDIGGAMLWSETHAEVSDWAARMVAALN